MDAADPDLPGAAVEHISQMPTLAKSKHQEAMALLGTPDPKALPRMREVLRLRVLNVVDDVTRECLAAVPDTSISGLRVVRKLKALIARRGKPGMIFSDDGRELTSKAVLAW